MLTIKQKALSVSIDTYTGNTTIRYVFPIKAIHVQQFKDVAQAYNILVETYYHKKALRNQCTYCITAPSDVAFPTFRNVQKQLMLFSRQCKITTLQDEIKLLQ